MNRRVSEAVLWTGAVLGALCLGWTFVMAAFGLTPLVFTSGSMSPAIAAGDLAFGRTIDADEIQVGDVVSVVNAEGVRITHRVVTVDPTQQGATVTLKGDANTSPDLEPYPVTSVERVAFAVPKAGHVVNAAASPAGMFAAGLLVAAALAVAFARRPGPGDPVEEAESSEAGARARRTITVGACLVAVAVAAIGTTATLQPTRAAFTDSISTGTGTFGSHTMSGNAQPVCTTSGFLVFKDAILTWPQVDSRYSYVVEFIKPNGTSTTQTLGAGVPAGGTVTMETASFTFLEATGDYSVKVTAQIAGSSWRATTTTTTTLRRTFVVGWSCPN